MHGYCTGKRYFSTSTTRSGRAGPMPSHHGHHEVEPGPMPSHHGHHAVGPVPTPATTSTTRSSRADASHHEPGFAPSRGWCSSGLVVFSFRAQKGMVARFVVLWCFAVLPRLPCATARPPGFDNFAFPYFLFSQKKITPQHHKVRFYAGSRAGVLLVLWGSYGSKSNRRTPDGSGSEEKRWLVPLGRSVVFR